MLANRRQRLHHHHHHACGVAATVFLAFSFVFLGGCLRETIELFATGDVRELRPRSEETPQSSPHEPAILVLALDGVNRDLLYGMLRRGELPRLARLLGAEGTSFPRAHFDDRLLAILPSSTIPAWVTLFTGVGPARHGASGNEFFVREERAFVAPAPVTVNDVTPTLECFNDGYLNRQCRAPSVYERMRERDPNVLVWVAMHQFYAGADKLLLTDRKVLADAFRAFLEHEVAEEADDESAMDLYRELDEEVVEAVVEELESGEPVPDVLTVYLTGTDQFAHVADAGPDEARRLYLREVLDPLFGELEDALESRHALENRFVVLVSDHGHTEVLSDPAHALGTEETNDPPAVLREAGYVVRPFELEPKEDAYFDAVLAYQGAMAYVYVADRSSRNGDSCDWKRPPRFVEDVLPVADAFFRCNADGFGAPEMKGTLDLVLTREPVRLEETDRPFSVYVGDGRLVPIAEYLARHPRPEYPELEARLEELAVGPYGERCGDVVLIAHNGDRDHPRERYYFSGEYRSWHGSPSRGDSEIPLIVAHPRRAAEELREIVDGVLGDAPFQRKFTDLLLALRFGAPEPAAGATPAR